MTYRTTTSQACYLVRNFSNQILLLVDSGSDWRHPICDLLERLNDGYSSGKPKGFHRAELGLGKPGSKQMTDAKKGWLFAEVMYLGKYLATLTASPTGITFGKAPTEEY